MVTACPDKHAKALHVILPSHSWVHHTGNASDKATLKITPLGRLTDTCDGRT
ncbi:hypothetical protein [Desulforhabdus sp. TSK]|uniref:hypothetical protein n=1 Tax=Desulforhabdus sp. TSK TaxID=2925014 RepID=UPI001FC834EA|nr:hypothetical protein [Desulforhabdus sp. TSK]